jgi:hypothetical protein
VNQKNKFHEADTKQRFEYVFGQSLSQGATNSPDAKEQNRADAGAMV